tara:strand:+ start:2858 stop:3292 length:435 start_codon:yes stop_codon:yes gene_type:complete
MTISLSDRVKREVKDAPGLIGLFFDAAALERRLPRAVDLRAKGCWPEFADDPHLAFGYHDIEVREGAATSNEVTRYDLAWEITPLLDEDDRKLVWAAAYSASRRARGARWKAISKLLHCHPATAKRRFERAMWTLWAKLLVETS